MVENVQTTTIEKSGQEFEVLLTPQEVQKILNISEVHFRKLVFRNSFPRVKIGKLIRFRPADIRAYIEKSAQ